MFFFFNDTATTEIYTLSLHDALPISRTASTALPSCMRPRWTRRVSRLSRRRLTCSAPTEGSAKRCRRRSRARSEEHTSELQSRQYLVCRLLLEKKKKKLHQKKSRRIM